MDESAAQPQNPPRNRTLLICEYINSLGMNPKSFVQNLLDSNLPAIVSKRQFWGTETGWESTQKLIMSIKRRAYDNDKKTGTQNWSDFVLNEAHEIVNREEPPRGHSPKGNFYSTDRITYDFFKTTSEDAREKIVVESMPFLYALIYQKIELANTARMKRRQERRTATDSLSQNQSDINVVDLDDTEERILPNNTAESMEGLSHSENISSNSLEIHRLKHASLLLEFFGLPATLLSMIAFACNQCCNGMQIQNSIAFIACGVSERVNDHLHFLGLTTSRQTGLKAMDTLGRASSKLIKERMEKSYNLRPFMTLDNIDIQARIHNTRIEATTKLFHGSYGYLHFLPPHLINEIDPEEASVGSLLKCINKSQEEPFELHSILPNQDEKSHWKLVLKAQLSQALLDYEIEKNSPAYKTCKASLAAVPPPVDAIKWHHPDLMMLKMMSASDSSSGGVAEMLEQCQHQTGEDPIKFARYLQVLEGDMGTCLNFESLIRQRFPASSAQDSLNNVLNLPGLAHTMWNVSSKVISHHWGDPKDSADTGLHRTAGALAMKTDKLPSQQDFNSLMQMIHKSHTATLVFLLKQMISNHNPPLKLDQPGVAQSIIDKCYERYFSIESLEASYKSGDWTLYNLRLRLRDFASIIEGDQAMRAGDIGRTIQMWKRWAVMAQGIKGLSHYAIHLPRFILILQKFLPPKIAKAIKHSLLIPTGGRDGHWVAKDFYLEIQNYWLKYFYNNSGQGTNIERLMERFSILIPLVSEAWPLALLQSLIVIIDFDTAP
ncbi:hypothetical protein DFH28DRAFT_1196946 [Melampsora americana]|nr:hypothetical protein DFH28DRAFT_1196946 [Melampsora americana]